jgi:hypothetical protein
MWTQQAAEIASTFVGYLSSVRSTNNALGYMYVVKLPSAHSVSMSEASFQENESTMDCSFTTLCFSTGVTYKSELESLKASNRKGRPIACWDTTITDDNEDRATMKPSRRFNGSKSYAE